jgi:hypothetical protein
MLAGAEPCPVGDNIPALNKIVGRINQEISDSVSFIKTPSVLCKPSNLWPGKTKSPDILSGPPKDGYEIVLRRPGDLVTKLVMLDPLALRPRFSSGLPLSEFLEGILPSEFIIHPWLPNCKTNRNKA